MGERPTVAVVGSINMDLVATVPHLPAPGETVLGNDFTTSPGGKGSNQAVAAARAGAAVTFVGAVGTDAYAGTLAAALTDADVSTRLLRRVPGPSGMALISVDENAENSIIVIPGANATVTALSDDDIAAITGSRMLLTQLETPLRTVVAAARAARSAGVPVVLNPSPVQPLPAELRDAVTVLVVNQGEEHTLGAPALSPVPHLVTTLGAGGARYRGPDGEQIEVPAPRVEATDTTGAGDAFAGALVVAWAEGCPPRKALQRACAAGALATTVAGAASSAPDRRAIDRVVADTYGG